MVKILYNMYMKYFRNNKPKIFADIAGSIFFVALGVAIYFGIPLFVKGPVNLSPEEKAFQSGGVPRRIDGVLVPAGRENFPTSAVIVENHIDARPLSGLARASLVYEAPVEGGITRFLAIFAGDIMVDDIGPVRSARPYFIDLAEEFGGIFVHVGGSEAALVQIIEDAPALTDLDLYYKTAYYWRDEKRFAPHNVYTSSKLLADAADKLGGAAPAYESWQFKADAPFERRPEKAEIAVYSDFKSYAVKWVYDKVHNDYVRYEAGKVQKDKNGPVVRAKNVVVLKTDIEIVDAVTRRRIKTVGEGEATVYRDGEAVEARWKRTDTKSRMKFYAPGDDEILFNAGATWIEIVSN